jgi:uncharacterized protein (TIGR03032 family)
MFHLDSEFHRLPLRLDAARLAEEVRQFSEEEWRAHPQGHAGNTALPLIAVGGGINDEVKGPMRPTPHLARCPYIQQVLAAFQTPLGRARLMRIAGQSDATPHIDTNYYWMHHVRIHVPAVTYPEVRFLCLDKSVHMAAGEAWIFDSWKTHNVVNPVTAPRIHLVADTVGSAHFWELVEQAGTAPREVHYVPSVHPVLPLEEENFPLVMTPFEQQALASRMWQHLPESTRPPALRRALDRLHQQWHALWTEHREAEAAWPLYRETIATFDARLPELASDLRLINGVPLLEALRQTIVRPAVNPEVAAARSRGAPAPSPKHGARAPLLLGAPLDRPVFIVAAPRSGSSMLFELLARSPDVWTIGGESHLVIEGLPKLDPARRGYDSNRLTEADAGPETVAELQMSFYHRLRDRDGRLVSAARGPVRMLEKTPKNALRIPFLAAAFPGARFIFLYREPRGNVSSILDAWRSQKFVTYPAMPDWPREEKWSLLLTPGWRQFAATPVPEIAARQWIDANCAILDDLATLAPETWCALSYEEVSADPQAAAERLSAWAGWHWDVKLHAPLPHSRHTLTAPDPEKWRRNETALAPVLPLTAATAVRCEAALRTHPPKPMATTPASAPIAPVASLDFSSEHTTSFPEVLDALGITIAVSTYQAGKLILLRAHEGVLNTHFRDFQSPMGLAYRDGQLAVGSRHDVWTFRAFREGAADLEPRGVNDAVFLPSMRYVTGDIRIHEIAWGGPGGRDLWAVNTRFSCLCTFDGYHNFVPRWRPPFVTALRADDRCHLNGMALVNGAPAYVTCHAATDGTESWRAHKASGGVLLDVASGETIASALSMPHSPRFYDGRLWVLESGSGRVCTVDLDSGKVETVAELPGFTRGLDFHGPFAFIGLSQVRETAAFSGIAISEAGRARECGVWVLDIRSGQTVAFLRFSGSVTEIFAVHVLPHCRHPELINEDHELIAGAFFLPPEALTPSPVAAQTSVGV